MSITESNILILKLTLSTERKVEIQVSVSETTYNSWEYYSEPGGNNVTTLEVTEWELASSEVLSDNEFDEFERLELRDIQNLVNEIS